MKPNSPKLAAIKKARVVDKKTQAVREAFLQAYSRIGTIRGACEAIGCSRQTILEWRNKDPAFALAFETADVEFTEALVSIVHQRAANGSDNLLMFAVKKRDPSFRDNMKVEHSGKMTLEQLVHASVKSEGGI